MLEKLKIFILKCLALKVKGKVIVSMDGSGKVEGIKYGIELTHETELKEEFIPQ
jgi:hypothetical protein